MRTKQKLWIVGIMLAGIGIVLARVLARMIELVWLQFTLYLLGVILGIAGLGIILRSFRK